ncbi:MAG: aminopeptidase [Holophagaceae bacterium]|nr:aminopeptidase [Holophagaceae bacterium]
MRRGALLLCLALSLRAEVPGLVVPSAAEAATGDLKTALDGVDAARIKAHIQFLADPKQQGRGLGTRGLARTERYLHAQMKALGLQPVPGQASMVQPVPLRRISRLGGTLQLSGLKLQHGEACRMPQRAPEVMEGELIQVGYGIQEPELGHDDLKGLDLKGKIVLLRGGVPEGKAWRTPERLERWASPKLGERYDARLALLEKAGARAVIAFEEELEPLSEEVFFRPEAGVRTSEEPPLVRVKGALPSLAPGSRGRVEITGKVERWTQANLIGYLPGRGQEALVIGAHMDHLGMAGGLLHPGADDNASGVSALLEIIRALAGSSEATRCPIIFAFWTGEEDGKFGSGHYTRHPLWSMEHTRAYLNLDMIGHPWTAEELRKRLEEVAPGQSAALLARIHPEDFNDPGYAAWTPGLAQVLDRAGRASGMALLLDPGDGASGGSDYRDFARLRVPFIRFFGNFFPDYHLPGDTAAALDPAQVRRMARLALATAWFLSH